MTPPTPILFISTPLRVWFSDETFTVRTCTKKRAELPPTPRRPEKRSAKTRENKTDGNIRRTNVANAMSRVPPSPKHRVQDSRDGHVTVLNEAGLEPTYVHKKVSFRFEIRRAKHTHVVFFRVRDNIANIKSKDRPYITRLFSWLRIRITKCNSGKSAPLLIRSEKPGRETAV